MDPDRTYVETPMSQQFGYPMSKPGVVVPAARLLFMQGQGATGDELSIIIGDTMAEQTRQVFKNLQYIVRQAGGKLEHIVQMLIFVADMSQFGDFVEVRKEFYPAGIYPPATVVEASRFADERYLVEVHAIAALPEGNPDGDA
jgi:enamine deaminase RidA (YjgF/YER057c/UK114 family)